MKKERKVSYLEACKKSIYYLAFFTLPSILLFAVSIFELILMDFRKWTKCKFELKKYHLTILNYKLIPLTISDVAYDEIKKWSGFNRK